MFHVISAFSEGRVIPTELQKDALDLRKAMKYDDDERQGWETILNYTLFASAQVRNFDQ